ncbi:EAL domain-containing protein [Sphingomonas sp. PL-96]|uniref:sensor domain-containing phosphodiesterase n=1 Tax=Sphingomonas sp. PL-96 TaxID=2887201 RepID=UPI001E4E217D|nr:EAL domain-containing protein [Sphingomonas sp. PL-96]MCC2977746.1 EAL domain-containing protein [Sphingomonas sp. PL-96]
MERLLELQNVILEMIAKGEALERTGTRLCLEVEKLVPGAICSVLTVDSHGLLHPLAGPSLPSAYSAALDGIATGPRVGSCGTAAFSRTPVTVTDIATDDRWTDFRHLALPLGLRACWSSPILDAHGAPVGTFAFYYRECRGPTPAEEEIVGYCVHLGVIAIERDQRVLDRERRAYTDALTGLANRAAFEAALGQLPCTVPEAWAIFVVDLDNLKVVNDTFGHHTGDCLLRIASERISNAVWPDRCFRIGGDEFAVIVQSASMLQAPEEAAEHILATLRTPSDCAGHVVVPRATIGGALLAEDDRTAERVRQNADFALYHAKESGRGGFIRYWPGIGTSITRRLTAIRDVDEALRDNRIEAHYQPIVLLETRQVVGLEALCRMRVGDRVLPAAAFHEATTDAHVAHELTARMMALIAADVRHWLDLGIPFKHVGINVSSADMHGSVDRVLEAAFAAEGVPLQHVILEVTESVYMGQGSRIVQSAVEALRAKGLRVALDDFGTGFASLTHLLTVPVDIIKIDKSFVDRLAPGDPSEAIIEGLIRIAGKLDIRVVAEGIETEAQARHLASLGCLLGQGYLFSRPVDRDATTALLMGR